MLNFDWLAGISTENAKLIFYALYILVGILVLLLPREYVYEGIAEKNRHWWNNLKLWALTVLSILFITYYIF